LSVDEEFKAMNEGKKEVLAEAKGEGFLDRAEPSSRRRRGHLVRLGQPLSPLAEIVPTWAI
jgi:hypothetical protein